MNKRIALHLGAFRRVQSFLDAHPTPQTVARATLADVITQLTQLAVDQNAGTRAALLETQQRKALRDALLAGHMEPIARVARGLKKTVSGLEQAMKLPSKTVRTERLIAAAGGMATAVAPHADLFIAHGLPQDFIAQLNAAAAAIRDTIGAHSQTVSQRLSATKGLKEQVAKGHAAVQAIDAVVRRTFRGDPQTLAVWRAAASMKAVVPTSAGAVPAAAGTAPASSGTSASPAAPVPAATGSSPAAPASPVATTVAPASTAAPTAAAEGAAPVVTSGHTA